MNLVRRSTLWGALLLVTVMLLAAGYVPTAEAAPAPAAPRTYPGPEYSDELPLPPTRPESQSKLWFHADAWWALLLEPNDLTVRVHELMPDHTWRPTSAVVMSDVGIVGDTVRDGDTVHVATRQADESLQYVRLSFDAGAREYRVDPPRLVTTRGSLAAPVVATDTTGRLWIAFATYTEVVFTYSDDGGVSWARVNVLAGTGTGQTPEAADLVAFDDRIGLLWSDQRTGSFEFASHRDGDAPTVWLRERALSGPAEADDHISLMRVPGDPSDRLVAAVKTSQGDLVGEPDDALLIEVLLRSPEGQWSRIPVGTVADRMNDPVIAVDESTQMVHVFTSLNGNIIEKRAPLDDIRFPAGPGNLFVLGITGGSRGDRGLVDPTTANHPVDADSGLVVLASDALRSTYRHAELPIGTPLADPTDQAPPNPPERLQGSALSAGTVSLSWAAASDGERWWPAADGVPVQEYVVLRDGTEIATVTETSFIDGAPTGSGAAGPSTSTYEVQAVDVSGNRSAAARLVVERPGEAGSGTPTLVGIGLLLLAGFTGALAIYRRVPPVRSPRPELDERVSEDTAISSAR